MCRAFVPTDGDFHLWHPNASLNVDSDSIIRGHAGLMQLALCTAHNIELVPTHTHTTDSLFDAICHAFFPLETQSSLSRLSVMDGCSAANNHVGPSRRCLRAFGSPVCSPLRTCDFSLVMAPRKSGSLVALVMLGAACTGYTFLTPSAQGRRAAMLGAAGAAATAFQTAEAKDFGENPSSWLGYYKETARVVGAGKAGRAGSVASWGV